MTFVSKSIDFRIIESKETNFRVHAPRRSLPPSVILFVRKKFRVIQSGPLDRKCRAQRRRGTAWTFFFLALCTIRRKRYSSQRLDVVNGLFVDRNACVHNQLRSFDGNLRFCVPRFSLRCNACKHIRFMWIEKTIFYFIKRFTIFCSLDERIYYYTFKL